MSKCPLRCTNGVLETDPPEIGVTAECPYCKPARRPPEVPAPDDAWADKPLPEDTTIRAAHPTRTGRHDLYAEAMRMVGAKHSKRALVELVNWLLHERSQS